MTLADSIQGIRLRALELAQELGSVTEACEQLQISRALFYRWRKRFEGYGPDGLHPKRIRAGLGRPSSVTPEQERAVIALALASPTWGPQRLADQLLLQSVRLAPSTIHRLLRRTGLGTRAKRLVVVERHSARTVGLLTERTREALLRARFGRTQHVQAEIPGELVCFDSFYVGKLKGVGPVWQLTACDAACSFAFARIVPGPTAQAAGAFLRDVVLPGYRAAGWKLQRVLTDHGNEFKADFDQVCQRFSIRHTRTKPRHCWTNGFVERLQGTILHEHWRVAFRRRYFTSRRQLQTSLDGFLDFYNFKRPHRGYRLNGAVPAQHFFGAVAVH
jgi:transposase InsO family protein